MATLLLIDDDRSIREMLDMLFSKSHECHTADRAEQALEFLEFQNITELDSARRSRNRGRNVY